jgi:hypothetical protein
MKTTKQMVKKGAILVVDNVVRIYEQYAAGHPNHKFRIRWQEPGRGEVGKTRTDYAEAVAFAKLQAKQILAGTIAANRATPADLAELVAARFKVAKHNSTLLGAVEDWCRSRDMVGDNLIDACKYWNETRSAPMVPTMLSAVMAEFIAEKDQSGRQGRRTYSAKFKACLAGIGDRPFHTLTRAMLAEFFNRVGKRSAVTSNDYLKRMKELTTFAKKMNYAPRTVMLDIDFIDAMKEPGKTPEIISPAEFYACLVFIAKHHPHHLAALVLAGFCGLRQDEIQGQRPAPGIKALPAKDGKPAVRAVPPIPRDQMPRQRWEDIHLDVAEPFLNVTKEKENTRAFRPIPICPAAVAWLKLCFVNGVKPTGYVGKGGCMERVRDILQYNKVVAYLGDNVFRHGRCSYRYKLVGARISAEEAGHSEEIMIKHYRNARVERPDAETWFKIMPPDLV